jgi:hypothetical protein
MVGGPVLPLATPEDTMGRMDPKTVAFYANNAADAYSGERDRRFRSIVTGRAA